jgi:hypothetical protein
LDNNDIAPLMTHIQAIAGVEVLQDSFYRNGYVSGEQVVGPPSSDLNPLDSIHSTRMPDDSGVRRITLNNEETCGSGVFIIAVVEWSIRSQWLGKRSIQSHSSKSKKIRLQHIHSRQLPSTIT